MRTPSALPPDLEDLATEWLARTLEKHPDQWQSWQKARDLAEVEPERAWQLTLSLIARVPDYFLQHIAANILEHILEFHAQAFVDRVEVQARSEPRFRECLSTVWLVDDYAPPETLQRLNAATGNRLDISSRAELEQFEKDHDGGA